MKWKDELHAILFSLIGGARYGVKIRLPHAVIMTCLFRSNMSASEKLKQIIQLVREHATNLALFATIYKSMLLMLKVLSCQLDNQCITMLDETSKSRRLSVYLRRCGRIFGTSYSYFTNR